MFTYKSLECDWCFIPLIQVSVGPYSHYYKCPRCGEKTPGKEFDIYDIEE